MLMLAGHTVLETARDSLFLARLSVAQLPWTYAAIAVCALLASELNARLRARLSPGRLLLATLGLGAGVPIKVMSDRLGHATTSFTMDVYMHAIPAVEESAADQIAGLVFGTNAEVSASDPISD